MIIVKIIGVIMRVIMVIRDVKTREERELGCLSPGKCFSTAESSP